MKEVIGIDLGGTSINAGRISLSGEILAQNTRSTESGQSRDGVLKLIRELIEELMTENVVGIGIGSPGCIDSEEGKVLEIGGNIDGWAGTDIREELTSSFPDTSIFVENDANAAAYCEDWIGAARRYSSFVMLTLGTGVGGAVMMENKEVLTGHHFQGGELGHAILYPHGEQCNCGQKGCVDRYISGKALERHYYERTGEKKLGVDIFRTSSTDETCNALVMDFCKNLAIYLVSLKNIFDPEVIVIGGGVINSRAFWWDRMMNYLETYSNDSDSMRIVPAKYLNDAGMIGAGKIALDKMELFK